MIINNNILLSPDEPIQGSAIVIGAMILDLLKKKERIPIFDIYPHIKKKSNSFNYENALSALIFLYSNNIIDFDSPYIYNLAIMKKRQ